MRCWFWRQTVLGEEFQICPFLAEPSLARVLNLPSPGLCGMRPEDLPLTVVKAK